MTKLVDTKAYVTVLRGLVQEGKSVSLLISGNSMAPFLINNRDYVYFKAPDRPLRKGDIVFYQRTSDAFVMHRIVHVHKKEKTYDLVGDNQTIIEYGIREDQIFGLVTSVKRKGSTLAPGDFWWDFFYYVWIRILPARRLLIRLVSLVHR